MLVALVAFAVALVGGKAFALDVPKLSGRVSDYADLLAPEEEQRTSTELADYEKRTGHQFAVLTIETLDGDPIEDFSIRTVESWKLGREKEDNGLLLLVVKRDRKARIEVGYGLEGSIPDAVAARVVRNVLVPAFRQGDYAGGIRAGLSLLMKAGEGDAIQLPPDPPAGQQKGPSPLAILFFAFGIPLALILLGISGGRRGRNAGVWGGALGGGLGTGGYRGGGFGGGGFGGGGFRGGGGGFGGGGASGSW